MVAVKLDWQEHQVEMVVVEEVVVEEVAVAEVEAEASPSACLHAWVSNLQWQQVVHKDW